MSNLQQLIRVTKQLNPGQIDLLLEMAKFMTATVSESISGKSDILTPKFRANFSNRLLIHHATHEEKFNKKSFEYAMCAAFRSDGRSANIVSDPTNPGADLIVDGVKFSLKTEASSGIHPQRITISKLMEARWIRDCHSKDDFAKFTQERVVRHLQQYNRVLMLRAFSVATGAKYDLVEIPIDVLLMMKHLKAEQFREKTAGGGSGADVMRQEIRLFSVRFDGSVEKVTINNLLSELCIVHGTWIIPLLTPDEV